MKSVKSALILAVAMVLSSSLAYTACTAEGSTPDFEGCERCHKDIAKNFNTSLHHTGVGMYQEYEKGAAGYFGINMCEYYDNFNCSKCHVVSCTSCHIGTNLYDVHGKDIGIATCDPCHKKKQTSTFMGEMPMHKSKGPNADIHYEVGFVCQDCHTVEELHGDGNLYETQLAATSIECEDCHVAVKADIEAHSIHEDKLKCITCHSGWSLTCNGCHLETRKGTKPVSDEFYLGVAADGMITTFLKMDATYKNETHRGFGEWYSHTVTSKAKDCTFCHENPGVLCEGVEAQIIGEGGSLLPQSTIDRVLAVDLPETEKIGLITRIMRLFGW